MKEAHIKENGSDMLKVVCPICGKITLVLAKVLPTGLNIHFPLTYDEEFHEAYIDWKNADGEAEFTYVCDECGEILAHTIYELQESIEKGEIEKV